MGAAKVYSGIAGGVAVLGCIITGGAVGVNCSAVGRQQDGKVARCRLGSALLILSSY